MPLVLVLRRRLVAVRVFGLFGGALGLAWIAKPSFAAPADRLPRQRIFGIGLLVFAVGSLDLGQTHSHLLAWLVLALYGLFRTFLTGGAHYVPVHVPRCTKPWPPS